MVLCDMVTIGPDLVNAARDLSAHMSNPGEEHWKAMERCVGYLRQQEEQDANRLIMRCPRSLQSIHDCDSDYAKNEDDRKSISGRVSTLGGALVSWSSKKQRTVSLSSCQAEYLSLSECCQEVVFIQNMIWELTGQKIQAIIHVDNQGAIWLVKNQQVGPRTKHIQIRAHWIRELQDSSAISVRFCRSENNTSDIMTKNVEQKTFSKHSEAMKNGLLPCWREDDKSSRDDGDDVIYMIELDHGNNVCPPRQRVESEPPKNRKEERDYKSGDALIQKHIQGDTKGVGIKYTLDESNEKQAKTEEAELTLWSNECKAHSLPRGQSIVTTGCDEKKQVQSNTKSKSNKRASRDNNKTLIDNLEVITCEKLSTNPQREQGCQTEKEEKEFCVE